MGPLDEGHEVGGGTFAHAAWHFLSFFYGPDLARPVQRPRITRIEATEWETERHATIRFFDAPTATAPAGTFCMVWVPGVDEIPMGLGYTDAAGRTTLTIEAKGDCSAALLALDAGDRIGVRGPYGTSFALPDEAGRVCFIGGGTGIAPMVRGARAAVETGHDVTVVSGARSADLLLLDGTLADLDAAGALRYLPCTDDGSAGFDGFTTQQLEALWEGGDAFDYVCACGPEKMMQKVTAACLERGVAAEASLERYMKCATGICDACTVGDGLRLCVEGPVLSAEVLAGVREYGVGHRDAAGVMHPW